MFSQLTRSTACSAPQATELPSAFLPRCSRAGAKGADRRLSPYVGRALRAVSRRCEAAASSLCNGGVGDRGGATRDHEDPREPVGLELLARVRLERRTGDHEAPGLVVAHEGDRPAALVRDV